MRGRGPRERGRRPREVGRGPRVRGRGSRVRGRGPREREGGDPERGGPGPRGGAGTQREGGRDPGWGDGDPEKGGQRPIAKGARIGGRTTDGNPEGGGRGLQKLLTGGSQSQRQHLGLRLGTGTLTSLPILMAKVEEMGLWRKEQSGVNFCQGFETGRVVLLLEMN